MQLAREIPRAGWWQSGPSIMVAIEFGHSKSLTLFCRMISIRNAGSTAADHAFERDPFRRDQIMLRVSLMAHDLFEKPVPAHADHAQFKKLEHALIEKAEKLFRDML